MLSTRKSPATRKNPKVVARQSPKEASNAKWLAARAKPGALVLVGGSTLVDFRVRVAQGHVRHDLLPSFWSLAAIVESPRALLSVPLDVGRDPSAVPANNGIRRCALAEFADPKRYPNIAVLHFAEPAEPLVRNGNALRTQRSAIDLPSLLVPWLAFVWGAGTAPNPLTQNVGIPSAAFVETAFGMAGIELTPGLVAGSSCPEAIWQSAAWWHDYYERTADVQGAAITPGAPPAARPRGRREEPRPRAIVPHGEYIVRQPAAAVTVETA
jgi:hypothetical protein